jgi:hypothetical protein
MLNVRIGDLVFRGGEGSEGFFLGEKGLKGWFGGVDARGDSESRASGDGDFDIPSFLAPRVITLEGLCHSGSEKQQERHNDQLSGLFGSGVVQRVHVESTKGTTWADGKLSLGTSPVFEPILWGSVAEYALSVKFNRPQKYGNENDTETATQVVAYHYGNFKAAPVITVSGSMPSGYTINGPDGKKFTVTRAVTSGNPHTIDMRTGYLSVGGSVVMGSVTRADLWAVPRGTSVTQWLSPVSGSGTIQVRTLDTYI